jgi:hypothetical protein
LLRQFAQLAAELISDPLSAHPRSPLHHSHLVEAPSFATSCLELSKLRDPHHHTQQLVYQQWGEH